MATEQWYVESHHGALNNLRILIAICALDLRSLLHGLLASQTHLFPQHDYNGRIWYHQLYHKWTNSVRCQWRFNVDCRWHHYRRSHQLGNRRFRHGSFPYLREVRAMNSSTVLSSSQLIIDRWAWLPQLIVLFVLVGSAGSSFNPTLQSTGPSSAITAHRLSFFSLCLSVPLSWAGAGSDFYVYYPVDTNKTVTFLMTLTGLSLSFVWVTLMGVGLGAGVVANPAWSTAYDTSSGALILAGYGGLGGFGKFCGVLIAFGVIANNVPGTYAAALGCQVLGRFGKAIPRYLWVCVIVAIYFVCAIAGRNNLFAIFENFLALMGYWLMIFVCIVLEEHLIFRTKMGLGFDWTQWENQSYLPIGLAALTSFLIGWAGAIIGMDQVWFTGPVAMRVGDGTGADIGIWLGACFALVTYAPLRYLELKKIGR